MNRFEAKVVLVTGRVSGIGGCKKSHLTSAAIG